ncbi:MAG: HAMP domain-containing sensor histidine kinase [Terracidiphilus sp.]|jgi:signal transduction histidine kinase
MPDSYQVPAFILTALLLPAFGYLYLRFRDTRSLLWFLGFLFAIVRMALYYNVGPWSFSEETHPWVAATSQMSIQISSALFLGSLSPLRFRIGRVSVLYVIPYTIPLVIYSALFYGIFHGISPGGPLFLVLPALGALSFIVACFWGAAKGSIPVWLGVSICFVLGSLGLWLCFGSGVGSPLVFVECANHVLTALLLVFVFRRFTPGVVLSAMGFSAWSLSALRILHPVSLDPTLSLSLTRVVVMAKVVAAVGMILLVLEDELAMNKASQERERMARRELEAYTNLILSRRRVEDFDRQAEEICQTVVAHSRFAQAALLLESGGRYRLAGAVGLDPVTAAALGELAGRIPVEDFLVPGSAPSAVGHSQTLRLDLTPWLSPGDELKRLRFTSVLAVPMTGRPTVEGALLLAGRRPVRGNPAGSFQDRLGADDLLPIEMLTARLQATRSQTIMLEKLIDSEKYASLGQLAGSVTEQLNNPLTVILGYASLLQTTPFLDPEDRKGLETILTEARRMKSTLESMSRVSKPHTDLLTSVSVSELLADMEDLHRPEFLHRSIEFRLSIAPALPRVMCDAQQLRQAVLHCLQFAIEAVDGPNSILGPAANAEEMRTIRLEATSEGNLVQIMVAHTGPGFLHPDRAFDPFVPSQTAAHTAGLGLSLCASILRNHKGRALAVNLEPRGAAILLELRAA